MNIRFILVVTLVVTLCDGHGHHHSLLGGLLGGAHHAVKGTIEDVATVVTSGISQGFNLNFASNFQVGQQSGGHYQHHQPPPPPPPMGPEEVDVIVIVEEQTNNNHNQGYRPPPTPPNQNGYGRPSHPGYGPPRQPGYGQQSQPAMPCLPCQMQNNHQNQPGYNNNEQYKPPPQQFPTNMPNHGYGQSPPPNINYGSPKPQVPLTQPDYGQTQKPVYQNQRPHQSPVPTPGSPTLPGYGKPIPPGYSYGMKNEISQDEHKPAPTPTSNPSNGIPTAFPTSGYGDQQQFEDPTNIYKPLDVQGQLKPVKKDAEKPTTKKPLNNQPLYVPLNTDNDRDKLYVNAPKRETQDSKPADDYQEFPIDIRFKDE